jgi:hypothetical protein
MKRYTALFFAIVLAIFSQQVSAECSAETIKGRFMLSGAAEAIVDINSSSTALGFLAGRVRFNGVNKVTISNGKIAGLGAIFDFTASGRYKLNANCVGLATIIADTEIGVFEFELHMYVSGTAKNPTVDAIYNPVDEPGESGLMRLLKSRI